MSLLISLLIALSIRSVTPMDVVVGGPGMGPQPAPSVSGRPRPTPADIVVGGPGM
jgi:hypothetical protein